MKLDASLQENEAGSIRELPSYKELIQNLREDYGEWWHSKLQTILKTLSNVQKNLDHCWNYMKNLSNFFQTQKRIQWPRSGIRTWTWFKRFGMLSSQSKMEIGIGTCTYLRKCYISFIPIATITTQDTFHTTGLHNQPYLNNIKQCMKNLKVVLLFDVILENSTKFPLTKLLSRP